MKEYLMYRNDNYSLLYMGDEDAEIGKIVSKKTKKDVMYLIYDKACFERYNQHFSVLVDVHPNDGQKYPFVIMDDFYRNLFYARPEIFAALAMHELGHYVNGDLNAMSVGMSSQKLRALRTEHIKKGKVIPFELNADRFAVKQCGVQALLDALDLLIERRKQRDDPAKESAIQEFELRKAAIRKMK